MTRLLERQRHLWDFALSSLFRRKGKNAALLLVFTLVVFLLGSVLFLTSSLRREAALLLAESPEIVVQRTTMGRFAPIPVSYAAVIKKVRGVQEVSPRLWGYYYDGGLRANYTLMVPRDPAVPPGSVTFGSGISRLHAAYEGDSISLRGSDGRQRTFLLERTLPPRTDLVAADLLLMAENDFRTLTGLPEGVATDLAVTVRNRKELHTIAGKISAALPDSRPIIRSEILRTYDALFAWRSGMVLLVMTVSALAFLIFAWDKATGLSAEERREIGVLKAVGWDTSDILLMKTWEGVAISLTALMLGSLLAYLHVFVADAPLITPVLRGWSTLSPRLHLAPHPDLGTLVVLVSLTVIPYTVATIIPAWRAATIDPDAVMR